jgi:ornithine cyclodeaminase
MVKEGAHINAVGACLPTTRELDTSLIKVGKLYGDRVESMFHEAGDFIIPLKEGAIPAQHLKGKNKEPM